VIQQGDALGAPRRSLFFPLKARLRTIQDPRIPKGTAAEWTAIPRTPTTPDQVVCQRQPPGETISPVFEELEEPGPALAALKQDLEPGLELTGHSSPAKIPQWTPQPNSEFTRARKALGKCPSPTATASEARSAAAALRAILAQPMAAVQRSEPAAQREPEPELAKESSDDEPTHWPCVDALTQQVPVPVNPVCQTVLQKPARRHRRHRGRRGRRGQPRKSVRPVAAETVQCFSPVREHEERERRERPPRRYDKVAGARQNDKDRG
jgi:hypothetical protein